MQVGHCCGQKVDRSISGQPPYRTGTAQHHQRPPPCLVLQFRTASLWCGGLVQFVLDAFLFNFPPSHSGAHTELALRFDAGVCVCVCRSHVLRYLKKEVGGRKRTAAHQSSNKLTHTTMGGRRCVPRRRQNVRAGCGRQLPVLLSAWRQLRSEAAAQHRRA